MRRDLLTLAGGVCTTISVQLVGSGTLHPWAGVPLAIVFLFITLGLLARPRS